MMDERSKILHMKLYLTRLVMEIVQPGATKYISTFSDQQFACMKYFEI